MILLTNMTAAFPTPVADHFFHSWRRRWRWRSCELSCRQNNKSVSLPSIVE